MEGNLLCLGARGPSCSALEAVARLADADELFYEGGKGKLAVRNFVKVSQRQCRQAKARSPPWELAVKTRRKHGELKSFRYRILTGFRGSPIFFAFLLFVCKINPIICQVSSSSTLFVEIRHSVIVFLPASSASISLAPPSSICCLAPRMIFFSPDHPLILPPSIP